MSIRQAEQLTDLRGYSEQDAAKTIGISISTLRRARRAGRVSFYRVGARILYSRRHLAEFLELTERAAFRRDRR
jgi:excisionase family DNA binding protein